MRELEAYRYAVVPVSFYLVPCYGICIECCKSCYDIKPEGNEEHEKRIKSLESDESKDMLLHIWTSLLTFCDICEEILYYLHFSFRIVRQSGKQGYGACYQHPGSPYTNVDKEHSSTFLYCMQSFYMFPNRYRHRITHPVSLHAWHEHIYCFADKFYKIQ